MEKEALRYFLFSSHSIISGICLLLVILFLLLLRPYSFSFLFIYFTRQILVPCCFHIGRLEFHLFYETTFERTFLFAHFIQWYFFFSNFPCYAYSLARSVSLPLSVLCWILLEFSVSFSSLSNDLIDIPCLYLKSTCNALVSSSSLCRHHHHHHHQQLMIISNIILESSQNPKHAHQKKNHTHR